MMKTRFCLTKLTYCAEDEKNKVNQKNLQMYSSTNSVEHFLMPADKHNFNMSEAP